MTTVPPQANASPAATGARLLPLSPGGRRAVRRVLLGGAVVGVLLGVQTAVLHLSMDPFADTRVYYDAGARLNAGLPLYDDTATDSLGLYLYPPLLAIVFRPLAVLPFPVAALAWQIVIVGALLVALRRIGLREPVLIALGLLCLPIMWALSIGQAEPIITLLLTIATPASVALAGHIKLIPWLAASYWLGRRDRASLLRFGGWLIALGVLQLVLAPQATVDYLQLTWLDPAFEVRSIAPLAIHPALWLLAVAGLAVLAFRYARSPQGWAFSVALAVLAYPRLLVYQLMSLMAAFGGPGRVADRTKRDVESGIQKT